MSSHNISQPDAKNAKANGMTLRTVASGALFAATLAAIGFCAASDAQAKPGRFECFKLRQNCLGHAQKLSTSTTAVGSEKLTAETCEKLYLDAKDTGVWPAYKGLPAVTCAK